MKAPEMLIIEGQEDISRYMFELIQIDKELGATAVVYRNVSDVIANLYEEDVWYHYIDSLSEDIALPLVNNSDDLDPDINWDGETLAGRYRQAIRNLAQALYTRLQALGAYENGFLRYSFAGFVHHDILLKRS